MAAGTGGTPSLVLTVDASCDCKICCRACCDAPDNFPVYVNRLGRVVRYDPRKDPGDAGLRSINNLKHLMSDSLTSPIKELMLGEVDTFSVPPMLSDIDRIRKLMMPAPASI